MNSYRVLMTGESKSWCNSLALAFEEKPSMKVVDIVKPDKLLKSAATLQPDVIVWNLKNNDIVEVIAELKTHCPCTLLVLIMDNPEKYELFKLIELGVRGCLPLRLMPRQIVCAVELITVAGIMCLPRLNTIDCVYSKKNFASMDLLTMREREVLLLLQDNYSNQEIASSLCLSESTVKTHLHNMFRKLNVRSRGEALAVAQGKNSMRCHKPQLEVE